MIYDKRSKYIHLTQTGCLNIQKVLKKKKKLHTHSVTNPLVTHVSSINHTSRSSDSYLISVWSKIIRIVYDVKSFV